MSRNPLANPFLPTAIWPIPFGISPSWIASGIPPRTNLAVDGRTAPIMMDPTAAKVTLWKNLGQNGAGTSAAGSGLREYALTPDTDTIGTPIPVIASMIVPSSQSNSTAALLGPDGKILYEAGQFCHATPGSYAGASPVGAASQAAIAALTVLATPGIATAGHATQYGGADGIQGEGLTGACAGSGLSTLGGVIRKGEFAAGVIAHALRCDLNGHTDMSRFFSGPVSGDTDTGHRWPATKNDGQYDVSTSNNYYDGSVPECCEGSLLGLPSSGALATTIFGISSPTYAKCLAAVQKGGSWGIQTIPGQIMAVQALTYGWYPCNDSTNSRITFPFEQYPGGDAMSDFQTLYGYAWSQRPGANAFAEDWALILSGICVNDSNTAAQYATNVTNYATGVPANYTGAGGGAPVVPLSDPLSTTGGGLSLPFVQQLSGGSSAASTLLDTLNAKTTIGSLMSILVGSRFAGTAQTPALVGSPWSAPAQSGTANATAVLASHTVTTGNFVRIYAVNRLAAVAPLSGVAKTAGTAVMGSFSQVGAITDISSETRLEVWQAQVTTGGTLTVTVTYAANSAGGAIGEEYSGDSGSLDHAAFTFAPTAGKTAIALADAVETSAAGCLVIAVTATKATPAITGEGFNPSGTSIAVPDLNVQATGADNCQLEVSSQISGPAGVEQGFGATMVSGTYVGILLCFTPATTGGSAPNPSASGGGTWNQRASVNLGGGSLLGTLVAADVIPSAAVAASAIDATADESGSIAFELYEIAGYQFQAIATATGNTAAPSVSITPTATTDVQVGVIFWGDTVATITGLPTGDWVNDTPQQGVAGGAGSTLVSGANVPASTSSQTYSGTLSGVREWVAFIINYKLATNTPGTPSAPVVTATPGGIVVDWDLPSPAPTTSSTVEYYIGGVLQGSVVVPQPTSIETILGLDPTQEYTADVFCTSGSTNGTASPASTAVVPLPPPTTPVTTPLPVTPPPHPVISARYKAALLEAAGQNQN